MSNSTTLTIRLDGNIKQAAKTRAESLGISLSSVVENELRQFIKGRPVTIGGDSYVPTNKLRKAIAKADAEYAAGEYDLVEAEELDTYLDELVKTSK